MSDQAGPAAPAWVRHLPPGWTPDQVDLLAEESLPRSWARRWAEAPAAPVLGDLEGRWVSAAELEERTRRVASRLQAAGVEPGQRIVLSAASSIDLVIAHVAALRLGLVVVPVNGAYREREVAYIVSDCQPSAAVVDDATRAGWIEAAAPGCVVVGPSVDRPEGPEPELDRGRAGDLALICYTSGTTGAPKGAQLTQGNLLASVQALGLAWRWAREDRLVLCLPLFHLHGLGVGLHGTLTAGASLVLMPSFDVDGVLDAAGRHRASLFFGVPTMYSRLAASPRLAELGRLRLCVSGSAPLAADLHGRIAEGSGQRILERYGMTETVMNVSNPYDGERRPGTVGFPLPGVDVRLHEDSSEILLRGPNVFAGYWRREEASVDAFDEDGWFRSGDIGAFDHDGYLRIVGRAKELIISGGYNVYPREVEDVLSAHPQVAEVAVVGTASDEWGEIVTAFVVANGTPDPDALLSFAAEHLASFKRPRQVHYVEQIPRNALGKVLRQELPPSGD